MNVTKERITLEDTTLSAMMKLSEGNPGALSVLSRCLNEAQTIDPIPEPIMGLLMLDTFGIYGSDIWILYKDICGSSLALFLAVERAIQFGIVPEATVKRAIAAGYDQKIIDPKKLREQVREELPTFDAVGQTPENPT